MRIVKLSFIAGCFEVFGILSLLYSAISIYTFFVLSEVLALQAVGAGLLLGFTFLASAAALHALNDIALSTLSSARSNEDMANMMRQRLGKNAPPPLMPKTTNQDEWDDALAKAKAKS